MTALPSEPGSAGGCAGCAGRSSLPCGTGGAKPGGERVAEPGSPGRLLSPVV